MLYILIVLKEEKRCTNLAENWPEFGGTCLHNEGLEKPQRDWNLPCRN